MEMQFKYFERMPLSTLLQQSNNDWKWHIYTSIDLPQKFRERLEELTKDSRITIFYISSFKEFNKFENFESPYATVRLDGDDGLNSNFVETLQTFRENNKEIISFPYGKYFRINSNDQLEWKDGDEFWPNIACGLTAINFNIYNAGDHSQVNLHYKTHYVNLKNMWYVAASGISDTGRAFHK